MGTFRGLPPEVLETPGLDPEGDEDEPDEPPAPYELPYRIAGSHRPRGWQVPAVTSQADQRRRRPGRATLKLSRRSPAPAESVAPSGPSSRRRCSAGTTANRRPATRIGGTRTEERPPCSQDGRQALPSRAPTDQREGRLQGGYMSTLSTRALA